MSGTQPETGKDSCRIATSSTQICHGLIEHRYRVVRLSEDHYLVQWQLKSNLWCVINMAMLDEHAESCSTFRFRKHCEHLELIGQLCCEERQLTGRGRAVTPEATRRNA
jgi:hypothetical protein